MGVRLATRDRLSSAVRFPADQPKQNRMGFAFNFIFERQDGTRRSADAQTAVRGWRPGDTIPRGDKTTPRVIAVRAGLGDTLELSPPCDPLVGVIGSARTDTPETELPCPRSLGEKLQPVRVFAPTVPVEIGRSRTDGDEANVHVDAVAGADDVGSSRPNC